MASNVEELEDDIPEQQHPPAANDELFAEDDDDAAPQAEGGGEAAAGGQETQGVHQQDMRAKVKALAEAKRREEVGAGQDRK